MIIAPNFRRPGVIAGFSLLLQAGLVPLLSTGLLFAQGTVWMPITAPVPPAAPNGFSYLAYNSSTGLYWTVNPAGTAAGDAVLGWAVTDGTNLLAVSCQSIATPAAVAAGTTGSTSGTTGSTSPTIGSDPGLSGTEVMTVSAGAVTPNLAAGYTHLVVLTGNLTVNAPSSVNTDPFVVLLKNPTSGGAAFTVTFAAGVYIGVSEWAMEPRVNRYCALMFQQQPDGKFWCLSEKNGALQT